MRYEVKVKITKIEERKPERGVSGGLSGGAYDVRTQLAALTIMVDGGLATVTDVVDAHFAALARAEGEK